MKWIKFLVALLLSIGLVYSLNSPIKQGNQNIPPLGKFLNPFSGFWKNGEVVGKYENTVLQFPELSAKVDVVYDKQLVPHIFAQNLKDAYFVQGYIIAKHRLWQMDLATRAVSGRLSEILGSITLERDKLQRRKGLVFAAENALADWKKHPEDFANLQNYTAGINAYINSLQPKEYPIEFKLLNYSPEAWTNLKTALFIKSMAQSLCARETDLESTNSLAIFGQETFDFLYPEQNPKQSPIIPEGTPWEFTPVPITEKQPILMGLFNHTPYPKPSPFLGSNNWAVSGSKTKSGNPILCNDPHLGMTLPAVWFEIQISTPEANSYGVALPGFPGITIGFNDKISWGMTNVGHDVLDYYKILWTDAKREQYIIDDQIKNIQFKIETYHIKGQESVTDTVRYTEWGPIVYEDKNHPMKDLAMLWLGHDGGSNELSVFRKLHTSTSFDDYYEAVQEFKVPPQNIVFASNDGDIALKIQGKFPLKTQSQGRFIQDGSNSANDWHGYIPPEHNPQVKNPVRGFVSSANQHSTDTTYPYYYLGGFGDYRGRTLNELLDSMSDVTVEDMMALQNNNYSHKAADALPLMLKHLDWKAKDDLDKKVLNGLKTWNFHYDKDMLAPIVFTYWFSAFYELTWDEITSAEDSLKVDLLSPESWRTIALLENNPAHSFFDNKNTAETETAKEIVRQSFLKALEKIKADLEKDPDYTLAKHKRTYIPHIGRIDAFNSNSLVTGGDGTALNAIRGTHGPSWRMIVELSDPVKAYGVYPGGQSGNPGSPFYDNMLPHWEEGKYFEKLLLKRPDEQPDKILYSEQFEGK